jgi:hypothetical protein
MLDVRFSSALKAMLLLGHAEEEGSPVLNSTQLARSLNTNPSLVRKMMVPLVQDGLVASIKGRSGGVRLGRSPDQITLGEIYYSSSATSRCGPPGRKGPGSAWSPTTLLSTSSGSPMRPRRPSSAHWRAAPSPTASTSCAPSTGPAVLPLRNGRSPRPVPSRIRPAPTRSRPTRRRR